MHIKVLGTGCSSCKKLQINTEEAIKELGLKAEVKKVDDMEEIVAYGVLSLPALVVDEKVLFSGQIPSVKELKKLLSGNENSKGEPKDCCCNKGCCN